MIALYILAGLVVLILLLALIAPTDFKMERDVIINKPKAEVFAYLKMLKNQDLWSVWSMKDPNMKKDYRGTDGTVGFVSAWDSTDKNVGKGEQEIKKIVEGERIEFELRFEKPMKATNYAFLMALPVNANQTKVTWGFSGKSKRPMNIMSLLMKGMLQKAFDDGLRNLKNNLEK
jgi:uncharacterized protein YndB with AHSA1/START domain